MPVLGKSTFLLALSAMCLSASTSSESRPLELANASAQSGAHSVDILPGQEQLVRLPDRLRIVVDSNGNDFSLTKFILVSGASRGTSQGWTNQVDTGGMVAFGIQPEMANQTGVESASSFPTVVWRALESRFPGAGSSRTAVTIDGQNIFPWQVSLLLERTVFDAYWSLEERWLQRAQGGAFGGDRVVPIVRATYVLAKMHDLDAGEAAGDYTVDLAVVRSSLSALTSGAREEYVLRDQDDRVRLINHVNRNGGIRAPDGSTIEGDLDPGLAQMLFKSVREEWLRYDLRLAEGATNGVVVVRVKSTIKPGAVTEKRFRISRRSEIEYDVNYTAQDPTGRPGMQKYAPSAIAQVDELKLVFWPWGEWRQFGIGKIKVVCESLDSRTRKYLESRTTDVSTESEQTETTIKAQANELSEIRCKPLGYYALAGGFVRTPQAGWVSEQAATRQHFVFITPLQLGLTDEHVAEADLQKVDATERLPNTGPESGSHSPPLVAP